MVEFKNQSNAMQWWNRIIWLLDAFHNYNLKLLLYKRLIAKNSWFHNNGLFFLKKWLKLSTFFGIICRKQKK